MNQGRLAKMSCALTVVLASAGLCGCQAAAPRTEGVNTDFASLVSMPGNQTARGQKADARPATPPANPLNIGATDPGNSETRASRIRAVVNDQAILDEEVYAAAMTQLASARTEAQKAKILNDKLNEIIDREVILQDAVARLSTRGAKFLQILEKAAQKEFEKQWLHRMMKANNYTDAEKFKTFLRAGGMPIEMVQRQWERNFMAMEYLRHRIEPSLTKIGHLQIVQYYETHKDQFKVDDSVVWQDLFIDASKHQSRAAARQFAEVLAKRIRQGENFVLLSKQFDNGDSSLRENSHGEGNKRGEIQPPQAEAVLFNLRDGEVGPLVEVDTGYHIIKVVKRTRAGIQPLDETVQKKVKSKLQNEVFNREMKRIVNNLKRQAIIEVATEIK